jgi:folate-dependent phosphoribosylglycinamide formyltransferase PurN
MKITVFTSNQPRHLALINRLASISDTTYAVIECNTVFPGLIEDFFRKSEPMRQYFSNVMAAEKKLFGNLSFMSPNVRSLSIKSGDLNFIKKEQMHEALNSDVYVVFGASYIKGWLIDYLVQQGAINIHMGLSPYYRGSSCNFWALYDNNPKYVGATIHMLSVGLDSGPMLYHALPKLDNDNPFEFTMRAVLAAQQSLVERIGDHQIKKFQQHPQDKKNEIRYTKNSDFTDEVVAKFLSRNLNNSMIKEQLKKPTEPTLFDPFYA